MTTTKTIESLLRSILKELKAINENTKPEEDSEEAK